MAADAAEARLHLVRDDHAAGLFHGPLHRPQEIRAHRRKPLIGKKRAQDDAGKPVRCCLQLIDCAPNCPGKILSRRTRFTLGPVAVRRRHITHIGSRSARRRVGLAQLRHDGGVAVIGMVGGDDAGLAVSPWAMRRAMSLASDPVQVRIAVDSGSAKVAVSVSI